MSDQPTVTYVHVKIFDGFAYVPLHGGRIAEYATEDEARSAYARGPYDLSPTFIRKCIDGNIVIPD